MRPAAYVRVSTEEQGERYGLDAQLHAVRELAVRQGNPIPPSAEFVEEHTGTELDRPGLDRLRQAIRDRLYDVVYMLDPDRLTRRLVHQLVILDEWKQVGIRVEFVTLPHDDTPEGHLMLNIRGSFAEYEKEKIKQRTRGGKLAKARRGLVVASYPYGYCPDPSAPGQLLVHDAEASVVRMMYGWLIDERRSLRSIVDELRDLAIPAIRGPRWGMTQVRRILTSDRYTGRVYYNRGRTVAGGRRKDRPSEEWILVQIPAIITPERHAGALAQIAVNRVRLVGRPARFTYLLRGLLRCAECRSAYVGDPSHGRRYYRCRGRDRQNPGGACRAPALSAQVAETAVWEAVATALRRPAALRQAVERYETSRGARDVELRSAIEHLRQQLRDVERKERRLLDLYLDDQVQTDEVRERLRGLGQQRMALAKELARAETQVVGGENRTDAIEGWCAKARRGLSRLDDKGRRDLLLTLVDEIRVGRDRTLDIYGILPSLEADTELNLLR